MQHKHQLSFYLLIQLLHKEAQNVYIQVLQSPTKSLKEFKGENINCLQARIFELWEYFNNRKIYSKKLLKKCSRIHTP
jgi:hypothetical protein